eukprot:6474069-Amphidinium_carterae.2
MLQEVHPKIHCLAGRLSRASRCRWQRTQSDANSERRASGKTTITGTQNNIQSVLWRTNCGYSRSSGWNRAPGLSHGNLGPGGRVMGCERQPLILDWRERRRADSYESNRALDEPGLQQ